MAVLATCQENQGRGDSWPLALEVAVKLVEAELPCIWHLVCFFCAAVPALKSVRLMKAEDPADPAPLFRALKPERQLSKEHG